MINTGNYCPACICFFTDEELTNDNVAELTEYGANCYCPNGCKESIHGIDRQLLQDSDELEVSTPQMEAEFEKKMDELLQLISKANDISSKMERLSFTYQHNEVRPKDFDNY